MASDTAKSLSIDPEAGSAGCTAIEDLTLADMVGGADKPFPLHALDQ